MTWASNVGELGVRDILGDMEEQLEGINQALNTPSAFPGEVRMFVGEIPNGWGQMSRLFTERASPNSFSWLSGPTVTNGASNSSSSGNHLGVSLIGNDRVLVIGDFQASTTSSPASTSARIYSLSDGSLVTSFSMTLTRPAILERMDDGRVLVAGGLRSTTTGATPSALTFSIDQDGVTTTLAPMPEIGSSGVSGILQDGRFAVFGLRNSNSGNTATLKCLAYDAALNSWTYLPDLPVNFTYSGTVRNIGGRTFLIGRGTTAKVFEYIPDGPTYYQEVSVSMPDGVTGWNGSISATDLDDGRAAVFVTNVVVGGVAGATSRLFTFDGVSFEDLADLPAQLSLSGTTTGYGSMIASTGRKGILPQTIIISQAPGAGGQLHMLPAESTAYLALRAIKYARKLP